MEPELSELTTPVSAPPAIQRPATPLLTVERSATPSPLPSTSTPQTTAHRANTPTPPIHPRVQELMTDRQQNRQKWRRTVSPTTTEQQLLDIITQPTAPAQPNVPRQEEKNYYFALSLVPKLKRLLPRNPNRTQIQIMTYLADLELEDIGQRQHATAAHTVFPSRGSLHPQTSGFQPIHPTPTYHEEQIHHPQCPPCLNRIPLMCIINCSITVYHYKCFCFILFKSNPKLCSSAVSV